MFFLTRVINHAPVSASLRLLRDMKERCIAALLRRKDLASRASANVFNAVLRNIDYYS